MMNTATAHPHPHPLAHAVALGRLQASRRDESSAAQVAMSANATTPAATAEFADTMPLWFRSEAFAEDVADQVHGAEGVEHTLQARWLRPFDRHVLAAGTAVLRQTLQALKLQRW